MWYSSKLFRVFTCKEFWFVMMIFDVLAAVLNFYEGNPKMGIWMVVMTAIAVFFYSNSLTKPYGSMPTRAIKE